MKLLRAATLCVADLERSVDLYCDWLDYSVAESGTLTPALATSWAASNSTGSRFAVLQPASGKNVYLRFVEQKPHPDYRALRTFGWAAIELCVQDVLQVNERMLASPFEIIGPPRKIEGLDAIHPMQVKGPDQEIVYLTQINGDLPKFDLPRAASLIDRLFILVMACSDMQTSLEWMAKHIDLENGRDEMKIVYTMLANAFDMPMDSLYTISTMVHGKDVFLELDQMPDAATVRPGYDASLPQGIAIGTVWHPNFDAINQRCKELWIAPPAHHESCIYNGKLAGTLRAPDGTLIEVVAA